MFDKKLLLQHINNQNINEQRSEGVGKSPVGRDIERRPTVGTTRDERTAKRDARRAALIAELDKKRAAKKAARDARDAERKAAKQEGEKAPPKQTPDYPPASQGEMGPPKPADTPPSYDPNNPFPDSSMGGRTKGALRPKGKYGDILRGGRRRPVDPTMGY